ncbi:MAG: hypothetical protein EA369_04410 [Bradymonadales bacterium]|nr:MAG: hypothetical protein EA369_04410 [Bradymonadales bacterium]
MRLWLGGILTGVLLYGLITLGIRLHMTQLAYQFFDLKSYERSLKEENLRLKAELAEALSPKASWKSGWKVPEPSQLRRLP